MPDASPVAATVRLKESVYLEDPWQTNEKKSICHGYEPKLLWRLFNGVI